MAEDHLEVLLAYQTTKKTQTEETLYALAFGIEAMILVGVRSGNFRVETYQQNQSKTSDEGDKLHLDLQQEKQDQAHVTMATYQERVTRYFNQKVKH